MCSTAPSLLEREKEGEAQEPRSEQNAEVCDATDDDSSTIAGLTKKIKNEIIVTM